MPAIPDAAKRLVTRSVTIDGNTLDSTCQLLLGSLKVSGEPGLTARDDVAYSRQRIRQTALTIDRNPLPVAAVAELAIPGPAGVLPARYYRPETDEISPLLMYLHGGGWVIGDLDTHDNVCRLICREAGVPVLSVAYRLAPEHPAPAGLDDAYAAYRWALEHGGDLGTSPGVVAVGGDSAGGNLAAVVARLARDDGVPPALQLLLYPITDLRGATRSRVLFGNGYFLTAHDMDWCAQLYLGESQLGVTDPRVSPLLADDLAGLAPAIVVTAGFDPLRDEGEAYAERMRDAGVTVDLRRMSSLIHAFCNFAPLGGASSEKMAEIASALRAHLCYAR
ncbi:MAG: alpha/beta hydrolase [Mycobacteriaceae bacterium]|nr:alpha/beta hydrolase [Mycobacteriaceae bacterium]